MVHAVIAVHMSTFEMALIIESFWSTWDHESPRYNLKPIGGWLCGWCYTAPGSKHAGAYLSCMTGTAKGLVDDALSFFGPEDRPWCRFVNGVMVLVWSYMGGKRQRVNDDGSTLIERWWLLACQINQERGLTPSMRQTFFLTHPTTWCTLKGRGSQLQWHTTHSGRKQTYSSNKPWGWKAKSN